MEVVQQPLSTLGPTTSPWLPFWAAKAFIHWNVWGKFRPVYYSMCHNMLGRFLTIPRGGTCLRSPFLWEVPSVSSLSWNHHGLKMEGWQSTEMVGMWGIYAIQVFKSDSTQFSSDGLSSSNWRINPRTLSRTVPEENLSFLLSYSWNTNSLEQPESTTRGASLDKTKAKTKKQRDQVLKTW